MAPLLHPPMNRPQNAARGGDRVEEDDPLERMQRLYGLTNQGAAQPTAPATKSATTSQVRIKSLEEELQDTLAQLDIEHFEYKPVPRAAESEQDEQ